MSPRERAESRPTLYMTGNHAIANRRPISLREAILPVLVACVPSCCHSVFNFYFFAGKCPQTWSQLCSMNASLHCSRTRHKIPGLYRWFCLATTQARWMPKLVSIDTQSYAAFTISACYDWSVARELTSFPLRHWNLRNLTLPYKHSSFLPYFRMAL